MTIREFRERQLLTLQDIADKTNSTLASVVRWEQGQVMSFRKRKKFLEVFGFDPQAKYDKD